MNNSNGFAACYYVGDFKTKTPEGDLVIDMPVRFIENFVPVERNVSTIIKTGQNQKQTVLEPVVQDINESGVSRSQLVISKYQFQTYGEIEESNKELVSAYYQVLEARKNAELKPKAEKQANLEAVQ